MRRTTLVLIVLLVASNGSWYCSRTIDNEVPAQAAVWPRRGDALDDHAHAMASGTSPGATHDLVDVAAIAHSALETPAPRSGEVQGDVGRSNEGRAAERRLGEQVGEWRSAILQVHDPRSHRAGLDAMTAAIRSEDGALAHSALASLTHLWHGEYDYEELRDAIRARLADRDGRIRRIAARALIHVKPGPAEVDALLDIFAAMPAETRLLEAALTIGKRADGRLADAWLSAFKGASEQRLQLLRYLGGAWVSEEVEAAAIAAFQTEEPGRLGDWYEVMGSFRPAREARVRLVFDRLRRANWRMLAAYSRPRFERALDRETLDPSAKPLAVALALDLLQEPPDGAAVSFCLEVIRTHGTAADVPAVDAYASNPMVSKSTRGRAASIARQLERRR